MRSSMVSSTAFHHHLYKLFKRNVASIPTELYHHMCRKSQCLTNTVLDSQRTFSVYKCNFQQVSVNTLVYKNACSHSSFGQCCQHQLHSYSNPVLFDRLKCSSLHWSQFRFQITSSPEFSTYVTRRYHKKSSKFTTKDTIYSLYLKSLLEEYDMLNKTQADSNKTELDPRQLLRVNFLRPVIEIVTKIQDKKLELFEIFTELEGETNTDMKTLLEKEAEKCNEIIADLERELMSVLIGEDLADQSDIILEIAAGVGGQEAMLFATDILNMYCNYANYKGWNITGIMAENNEIGGVRKAIIEISGQNVYKHLKYEAGVHRVQRIPRTEKAGRIHTSTISVSILPQVGKIDIDIQPDDLKFEAFRGSGPGGQSVNTTDSAVRITHIPTGIVSECRQERSQIKNKEIAMKNLKNKLYQAILEEQERARRAIRKMQMGTRSRSDKIRTYNYQQDRITDHRLKESYSEIINFLAGSEELDNLISLLADQDKFHTLETMLEEFQSELARKDSGKS